MFENVLSADEHLPTGEERSYIKKRRVSKPR